MSVLYAGEGDHNDNDDDIDDDIDDNDDERRHVNIACINFLHKCIKFTQQ